MKHSSLIPLTAAAVVLSLWPVSFSNAQDNPPGDGPRRELREQGGGPGIDRGDRGDRGGRGGMRRQVEPSAEEWNAIEAFGEKHSPNRLKMLNRLRDEKPDEVRIAKMFLVGRYRSIEASKEHDPELYEVRLEGVELEDRIFGQVEDGAAKPDAPTEKKEALRADMAKWVTMNLNEREQRIERLAESIEEQRRKLEEDKARSDALIDQKMADVERDGIRGLLPEGVRKFMDNAGRGPGPGGPGEPGDGDKRRRDGGERGPRPGGPMDGPPPGDPNAPMP